MFETLYYTQCALHICTGKLVPRHICAVNPLFYMYHCKGWYFRCTLTRLPLVSCLHVVLPKYMCLYKPIYDIFHYLQTCSLFSHRRTHTVLIRHKLFINNSCAQHLFLHSILMQIFHTIQLEIIRCTFDKQLNISQYIFNKFIILPLMLCVAWRISLKSNYIVHHIFPYIRNFKKIYTTDVFEYLFVCF